MIDVKGVLVGEGTPVLASGLPAVGGIPLVITGPPSSRFNSAWIVVSEVSASPMAMSDVNI